MLFHWAPSHPLKPGGTLSKPLPTLSYWVCGRVIRNPLSSASSSPGATPFKEFYVAYHQSAPQNMVELAFRLAFGIHMWPVRKNNQRNIFTQVLLIQIDLDLDSTTNGALFLHFFGTFVLTISEKTLFKRFRLWVVLGLLMMSKNFTVAAAVAHSWVPE